MGIPSIVINSDSLILLVNRRFEKLSGYKRKEIEGRKKWQEFVLEEDVPKVEACKWQEEPADDENREECEFRFVDRLRNLKHVLALITAIPSTERAVMSLLNISVRKAAEEALQQRELELERSSQGLKEANISLKVLLKHKEEDKAILEKQMQINVNTLILPLIEDLRRMVSNHEQLAQMAALEKKLQDITSPFLLNMSLAPCNLTPRETQVAMFIKDGMTTKEMANRLNISTGAVDNHRGNIRSKLGIATDKKINLRSHLVSLYTYSGTISHLTPDDIVAKANKTISYK